MKNLTLFSLPRSGSTWLSKRLGKAYDLHILNEPFRVIFGSSNTQFSETVGGGAGKKSIAKKLDYLTSFLKENPGFILKETNLLFQIDDFKKLIPDSKIILLLRHPCAIFYSHTRINNVYEIWNYKTRIIHTRKLLVARGELELEAIYQRAECEEIQGSGQLALLFAHIVAQFKYLQNRPEKKLIYENLVTEGGLQNIKDLDLFSQEQIKDPSVFLIDQHSQQNYKIHGTKNPINPYGWSSAFTSEDFLVMERIIGGALDQNRLTEKIPDSVKRLTPIPQIIYQKHDGGVLMANRLVTIKEFCEFANTLVEEGIQNPHDILGFNASFHSIILKNGYYIARRPNSPMILVSPFAALAYATYKGDKIPTTENYAQLEAKIKKYEPLLNTENCNFSETVGMATIPGKYQSINGFYDIYGNVKEMAIDRTRKIWAVGGSYKDEKEDISLSKKIPLLFIGRELDIGFRTTKSQNILPFKGLLEIIRSNNLSPIEKFNILYESVYK